MGNLISCSTPSAITVSSARRAASPCSSALQHPARVPAAMNSSNSKSKKEVEGAMEEVARVLLVDGSVLQFRQQMKVLTVLAHYPDHFICPLDSLRPGRHSLPTLLPHDHLHLGRLYLLLPLHQPDHLHAPAAASSRLIGPRRQHALSCTPRAAHLHDPLLLQCRKSSDHPLFHVAAAADLADQHDPIQLLQCRKGSDHPRFHAAAAADHELGKVNIDSWQAQVVHELEDPDHHQQQLLQIPLGCKKRSVYPIHSSAHADSNDRSARPSLKQQKIRSQVGRSTQIIDHGYGDALNSRTIASCAAAQSKYRSNDLHHMKYFAPVQDDHKRPSYMGIMEKTKRFSSSRSSSSRIIGADDTPALKKAYNSDKLRRCRTWTPRLHAITETRSTS